MADHELVDKLAEAINLIADRLEGIEASVAELTEMVVDLTDPTETFTFVSEGDS
jgi:prefoldin subunit 5